MFIMPESYDSSLVDRFGVLVDRFGVSSLSAKGVALIRSFVRPSNDHPDSTSELQLSRLVTLLMVVLLLTFGAVYKLADIGGRNVFWPEMALAFAALLALAASYRFSFVRKHFVIALQALCYLAATWFIVLASYNAFLPIYFVGLLFIIPGLGVGYSVTLRRLQPLVVFFALTVVTSSAACLWFGGSSSAPALFIGALTCISLVTFLVAASRLDVQKQFNAIEERYRAVVEQASDGIYLLDANSLAFLDANPAFCRMIGLSLSELKSKSVTDLVVAPTDAESNPCGHLFCGRQAYGSERMLRRADGRIVYVELHIDRIRYADRDVLSVVVHDVSSRREYEERLLKAKEKAEEISSFKSSLLANMSHEIRTPLSSILGWTTVLNEELPENQRELLRLIEESGRRLHNTLDSVLELAQLDAKSKQLEPSVVDVSEVIRSIAGAVQVPANMKGLTLSVNVEAEPVWARLDVSCLRRLLSHVVDNAIKFTNTGSISFVVDATDSDVRIEIADTGVGISEDFLPWIFEEFKQESAGLNRDHEGNGLGLAIVRRLVDLLGGTIDVRSRRGEGSTFSITLPAVTIISSEARVT